MINKKLNDIGVGDISDLINNAISEGKTIDYKQNYNLSSEKEKGEFLADISSFANASGGDLIFGIIEEKGVAKSIKGVLINDIDQEKLKIESIVRDGIDHRVLIEIKYFKIDEARHILIIRTPKSWFAPHRVIYNGYSKTKDQFYSRNSAGKYPLDLNELKSAFILEGSLNEKIKNFKDQRIFSIYSHNTPIPLYEGGKIILHIIPLESFTPNRSFDISDINQNATKLRPIYARGWNHRINIDGFLTFTHGNSEPSTSYTQLYRNGVVESVEGLMLMSERRIREDGKKYIPSQTFETEIIRSLSEYLNYVKELGISTPFFVFLTITGVKDYQMGTQHSDPWDGEYKIDRDILNLPEQLIYSYDVKAEQILKPMFDVIWNACGYKRSLNFDDLGNWVGKS